MSRGVTGPLCNDEGSASVVAAGVIAAVASLVLVVAAAGAFVVARHAAQVAADMAAVAGAFAHYRGEDGCAVARDIARANGAALEACAVTGGDVSVTASVRTRAASAKAGPL
ncbi:Rv3654c family TadE-like protein [uncultured Corynebacterium sp.]|uniref:Rv3654c family TadE-like protein n=1 Tax=uncultured Corynebacterium sp. TaxID=159447 RepID=UPI0025FC75B0|nr:Rv3654c family TadE-like protein [uncultured Corynebacterium sp.]